MVKKYIMLNLTRMLSDLAEMEFGLLNIKNMKFPLILSLAQVATLTVQPGTPSNSRVPGRAPTPWDRKRKDDDKENHLLVPPRNSLDHLRRRATGTPVRRRLDQDFDDDSDEKENKPPSDENYEQQDHLTRLLRKWGEDIDWLKEKITQDLDNYKTRLGIPPLFS
ncbi:E4 [Human papillomavirus 155]|uniref:E4 n=1 Tax=Human papillomavirus 155 TaxID=1165934 RepID=G8EGT6_9PAPI|nr:E4 [Human papillomavirus 155]